jgi:6-pyruvoyltetrahydropterin/6-carboxytetrahydropterin synthase
MITTVTRHHDFSCGHRVAGHESKCANLHGHNYRAHFTCQAPQLDKLGRVIDFSCIKEIACEWIEREWDHKFLVWEQDPLLNAARQSRAETFFGDYPGVIFVPFNPTAENMATHLLRILCNPFAEAGGIGLISVKLDETRKCSAKASW